MVRDNMNDFLKVLRLVDELKCVRTAREHIPWSNNERRYICLSSFKLKQRQNMFFKNVTAVQPVLMQHTVDGVQKQALGLEQRLQPEQILSELGHIAHIEHLRGIADVPKPERACRV